jgi:hypothetical protein
MDKKIQNKINYFADLLSTHDLEFDDLSPHDIGIIKFYINLQYKTKFINYPYALHDHLNSLSKKDVKILGFG